MSNLKVILPEHPNDLKLAIKSSFPDLKKSITWLLLMYLSHDASELEPFEEGEPYKFAIKEKVVKNILDLLIRHGLTDENSHDEIRRYAKSCPLASVQMEALTVAFELFLPLARFTFIEEGKPMSAERSGNKRFNKKIYFSAGLAFAARQVELLGKEGIETICHWLEDDQIGTSYFTPTLLAKEFLQRTFFHLTASTMYRLETKAEPSEEVIFNTLGLYDAILDHGSESIECKEKKGALRILPRAIEQGVLPGLKIKSNEITLSGDADRKALEKSLAEEALYTDLMYVAMPDHSSTPTKKLSPDRVIDSNLKDIGENVIVYGVPGSGKSHLIDTEYIGETDSIERIVFHPDYLYANFVGQILPHTHAGNVSYAFSPGPFARVLSKALRNPEVKHILIIEEINRGNAAAIFGDIFQLLDRDAQGQSRYPISNHHLSEYIYGAEDNPIRIPSNLHILATMNSSDQSIFVLDTAFQRRWRMRLVPNAIDKVPFADEPILDTDVTWRSFVSVINELLLKRNSGLLSSEDKRIGAFFITYSEILGDNNQDARQFAEKVLKYLWDDAFKFDRSSLFQENLTSLEDVVLRFLSASENGRWHRVFNPAVCEDLIDFTQATERSQSQVEDSYVQTIEEE